MFGAILKATNSSFQKGITFCRSIYVKKVMTLLAFIFEQPSYNLNCNISPMQLTLNVVSVALDKGYIYIYIYTVHAAIILDYHSDIPIK